MTNTLDLGIEDLSDYHEIGSGGFATVYAAIDRGFQRRVAVKVLHAVDEDGRRRFDRERGLMGQLDDHINVVTPYRFGNTDTGSPYLIMEYLGGGSLQNLISRHGPIPAGAAIDLLIPIAGALGRAHGQGILHRDIKPANVLLTSEGVPKLADFGIAGIREATATQRAFTLSHSPPETFGEVEQRDERSDLYSLASTLYALVTGRGPFDTVTGEGSLEGQIARILLKPPQPTGFRELDAFLLRATAKHPDHRYPTASHFLEALTAAKPTKAQSRPVAVSTSPRHHQTELASRPRVALVRPPPPRPPPPRSMGQKVPPPPPRSTDQKLPPPPPRSTDHKLPPPPPHPNDRTMRSDDLVVANRRMIR